jgi:hypothetical protein
MSVNPRPPGRKWRSEHGNKVQKPSRERGLLSGVALALALALVASLLYVQPVIRAYWWIAAVKLPLHALQPAGK